MKRKMANRQRRMGKAAIYSNNVEDFFVPLLPKTSLETTNG
jgi:hypothetical protein